MKKEKKKMPVWAIVLIAVGTYILFNLCIIFGTFGLAFIIDGNSKQEFSENNGVYKLNKKDITIETTNNYYDEEDKCYVIETKVDSNEKLKNNNSLEIEYTIYDQNDYVIDKVIVYMDNIKDDNKWKKVTTYCENNAHDVNKIKLTNINLY